MAKKCNDTSCCCWRDKSCQGPLEDWIIKPYSVHLSYVGTFSYKNQLRGNDFYKIKKSIKVSLNERDLPQFLLDYLKRFQGWSSRTPGLVTVRQYEPISGVIQSGNIYISFQGLSVLICNFTTLLHHQSWIQTSLLQSASVVSEK